MVGIHERSGREKIFSSNVAHALNDETSRKYIQSLKRLVSTHSLFLLPVTMVEGGEGGKKGSGEFFTDLVSFFCLL